MIAYVVAPHPSDAELTALWLVAWGNAGPATFQGILSRSLTHVGAYAADNLVGFVNVAWDGGVHAFILDTCVAPQFRRQGIATRLVKLAAETAAKRGAVWLHVDFEPQLLHFYRGCGFRKTEAGLMRLRP